jgi:hypothetical protein
MPLATIRPAGEAGLYHIHFLDMAHPDQGLPGGGPVDPGYGRPGGGPRPGHDLPHLPGIPDHDLPTTPPPHVPAGVVLVLVRDVSGVWHWATLPPGSPPPIVAPPIATPPPPTAGTPLPPTAAPKFS